MKETTMTVAVERSSYPNALDAGIPAINYRNARHLVEAHHTNRQARDQSPPIALGPHAHELLTYELVRAVLRDPRLRTPPAARRRAVQPAEEIADPRRRIYALGYLALIAAEHVQPATTEHPIRRAAGVGTDLADVLLRGYPDEIVKTLLAAVGQSARDTMIPRMEGCAVNEELTSKELGILRLLATRLSRREIGKRLYVSLNTVKTHQRAVYRKLGVDNRSAAVRRALELDLL
jgi:LuxR family maltose regulon positive regulatory protein